MTKPFWIATVGVAVTLIGTWAWAQDLGGPAASLSSIAEAPFQQTLAINCRFRRECVEDQPCTADGFAADLLGTAGGLTPQSMVAGVQMITRDSAVELVGVREGTALALAGGGFAARHLLTLTDAGIARYTIHYMQGPLMVSYLGQCEES